jgi:hypothetical protein
MHVTATIQPRTPESRSTAFDAAENGESGDSLRPFGIVFGVLWLGMLVLLYVARRRQDALRAKVERVEATFDQAT